MCLELGFLRWIHLALTTTMPPPPLISSSANKPPFGEFYDRLPPTTKVLATSLLLLHLVRVLTGTAEASKFSLSAVAADETFWYRLVTGPALHASFLHVTFNCLALCHLGTRLESLFGTVLFFLVVATCWLFASCSYVGLVYLAYTVTNSDAILYQSAIGFSGVIFALAVIESRTDSSNPPTDFFGGRVRLSRFLVPFAMILVLQLLLPNVSLIGHVAGALFGLALSRGGLGARLFPSRAVLHSVDDSRFVKRIFSSSYKPVYAGDVSPFVSMCDPQVPWLMSRGSASVASMFGLRPSTAPATTTTGPASSTSQHHHFGGVGRVLGGSSSSSSAAAAGRSHTSLGEDEEEGTASESSSLMAGEKSGGGAT